MEQVAKYRPFKKIYLNLKFEKVDAAILVCSVALLACCVGLNLNGELVNSL